MSVKIRLSRLGKRNYPYYRIVATDESSKRDSAVLENLGFYNPQSKTSRMQIDKKLLEKWVSHGAILSDAVRKLIKS